MKIAVFHYTDFTLSIVMNGMNKTEKIAVTFTLKNLYYFSESSGLYFE